MTDKGEVANSLTALSNITNLKKLCNHPDLVYEKISDGTDGFENAAQHMPDNYNKKYFTPFPLFLLFMNVVDGSQNCLSIAEIYVQSCLGN